MRMEEKNNTRPSDPGWGGASWQHGSRYDGVPWGIDRFRGEIGDQGRHWQHHRGYDPGQSSTHGHSRHDMWLPRPAHPEAKEGDKSHPMGQSHRPRERREYIRFDDDGSLKACRTDSTVEDNEPGDTRTLISVIDTNDGKRTKVSGPLLRCYTTGTGDGRQWTNEMSDLGVLDMACSRNVAGWPWFLQATRQHGLKVLSEKDCRVGFRFGAGEPTIATKRVVLGIGTAGKSWAIGLCLVTDDVPLLISGPAQKSLNLTLHMGKGKADIYSLGVNDITFDHSADGIPTLNIAEFPSNEPSQWSGEGLSACTGDIYMPWKYNESTMSCMNTFQQDAVVVNA